MLYYASISDSHTGQFVGAVMCNRETQLEASDAAAEIARDAGFNTCLDIASHQVPVSSKPIPHDAIGRLLSYQELEQIFGELRRVNVSHLLQHR